MRILELNTERREIGNIGEGAAARHLKKCGFKIIKRNYVAIDAEIDIIAENKEYILFVEVKTRTVGHENMKEARPSSSVNPAKQRKIISVAKYFLATYPKERKIRFDIIEVYLNEEKKVEKLLHLESAFNYNTAYSRRM